MTTATHRGLHRLLPGVKRCERCQESGLFPLSVASNGTICPRCLRDDTPPSPAEVYPELHVQH